jgi:hypothetical protein
MDRSLSESAICAALPDRPSGSTQFREAEHGRSEKMEKYKDLPSPFKDFPGLF